VDPDSGCEKFADPDTGLHLKKNCVYLSQLSKKRTLSPDQTADPDPDPGTQENADPDPETPNMRIQCGSGSETLQKKARYARNKGKQCKSDIILYFLLHFCIKSNIF